jgi:hypothetical protein
MCPRRLERGAYGVLAKNSEDAKKTQIKTSRQVGRKRKGVLIIPIRITIPAVTQTRKRDG